MFRLWKIAFLFLLTVLLLVACGQTVEEQAASGIQAAKDAFSTESKQWNEEIEGIRFYKPAGFIVDEESNAQNLLFTKSDEPYILFINPNEESNSQLFYELVKSDASVKVIQEETFTKDGLFGFAAVLESSDKEVELIVGVGGVKMTTISKKSKIGRNLQEMMEIVRSIQSKSE